MKRMIFYFCFSFISFIAFAGGIPEQSEMPIPQQFGVLQADKQYTVNNTTYYSGRITLHWNPVADHWDSTNYRYWFYRYKITIFQPGSTFVLYLYTPGSDWGAGDIRNNETSITIPNSLNSGVYIAKVQATLTAQHYKLEGTPMFDQRIIDPSIPLTIIIDNSPPTSPSDIDIVYSPPDDPSPVVIKNPDGKIVTNNASNITFTWPPSEDREGDSASGLQCYRLYLLDGISQTLLSSAVNTNYSVDGFNISIYAYNYPELFHEGLNTLGLSAVDNLDNESDITPFSFYIDPEPPEMVQNLSAGLSTKTDDQGVIQSQNVILNWDPVQLDNPHDSADSVSSGVAGYERCFMPSAVFHGNHDDLRSCDNLTNIKRIDGQNTDTDSIELTALDFPEADRGQNYIFFKVSVSHTPMTCNNQGIITIPP